MSSEILSVSHLTVGYGEHAAAADVSFQLQRGEILCLVGESGCGKSTVLKALLAAPEIRVLSGSITLEGQTISELPDKERRGLCCERMGIVFQSPQETFNPIRSYRRQFIETLKSHGRYDAAAFDGQVEEAFLKVELTDWKRVLSECPFALSGGMNQRVALALALLLGQEILLCDEPTSALDATIQLQVAHELQRLRDKNGVTQIIVTHNLALARFLADRIGVMYAGRLVELGRASDVLQDPKHPYTRSLIAAIPGLDGRMPVGLPGSPPMTGPSETGCEFHDRCPLAKDSCACRTYAPQQVGDGHSASCCEGKQSLPGEGEEGRP
jgi:oligopeptide/dipeptide ABC transporter ATP-binding protein